MESVRKNRYILIYSFLCQRPRLLSYLISSVVAGLQLPLLPSQVPRPVEGTSRPILIINATAHVGNGQKIESSLIAIENGIITQIGPRHRLRVDVARYELIDAYGKHVYPGLILPVTQLGLGYTTAPQAIEPRPLGSLNPQLAALSAYEVDEQQLALLRQRGILLAQIVPQAGIISGSSSIVLLDGWNREQVSYKVDEGIHLHWPKRGLPLYEQKVRQIDRFFSDASTYARQKEPQRPNLRLEAMKELFRGKKKLYLHAYSYDQIISGLEFLRSIKLLGQVVLVGAHDAFHAIEYLKTYEISVLLDTPHRLPSREDEPPDLPYRLAYELHKAGIVVGLCYSSPRPASSSTHLALLAATVAAYGLDPEEALGMITEQTARILGIEQRTGTLEVGKDAHLLISEGDLLDMRSHRITSIFISGRPIHLSDKSALLHKRFLEKYGPKEAPRLTVPRSQKQRRKRKKKK